MFHIWRGVISRRVKQASLTLTLSLCALITQAVLISPATAEGVVHRQLSAVSWGPGRLDVFVAKRSGLTETRIWVRSFENGWTGWSTIAIVPGTNVSIDAVSWGPGRIDLVVGSEKSQESGKLDAVWHKYLDTSIGPGWKPSNVAGEYMGGSSEGMFKNGIQIVSTDPNRLDILPEITRSSERFLHKTWNRFSWVPSLTGWNAVYKEPTNNNSRHHAVAAASDRVLVFRIPDNLQIEQKAYNLFSWSPGWLHINGGLGLGIPFAVSPTSDIVDVFVRGTDNAVWMDHVGRGNVHNAWHWMGSGGNTRTPPSAVSTHMSTVNVFENAADANNNRSIYRKRINIASGSPTGMGDPWMDLGDVLFTHPPEAVSWDTNRIDLFGYGGGDGNLYHKWSNDDGSTWGPSQSTWESLGKPPDI